MSSKYKTEVLSVLVGAIILSGCNGGGNSSKDEVAETNTEKKKPIKLEQPREDYALIEMPLNHSEDKAVSFRVVEGDAIAEGDINLGKYEELKDTGSVDALGYPSAYDQPHELDLTDSNSVAESQFSAWGGHRKWANGVVPYTIRRGNFTAQDIAVIKSGLKDIENAANIKFVPAWNGSNHIEVYRGQGCSSAVGMTGGKQYLSLGYGCVTKGIAIHEFMHALGFYHEQSRADRDQYVNIHWSNIQNGMGYNFNRLGRQTTSLGPYDYGSIMHYEWYAFSWNGRPTISAKVPGAQFGQRRGLSKLDIDALQKAYGKGNGGTTGGNSNEAPRVKLKYSAIWMWNNDTFKMPVEFYDDKDTLDTVKIYYTLQRNDTVVRKTYIKEKDQFNKNLFYIPLQTLNPTNNSKNAIKEVMTLTFTDSQGAKTVVKLPIYVYNRSYWRSGETGVGFKLVNKDHGVCMSSDNGQITLGECENAETGFAFGSMGQIFAKGKPGQCLAAETLEEAAALTLKDCDVDDATQKFQYEGGKLSAQEAMHLVVNSVDGDSLTLENATTQPSSSVWSMQ